MLTLARISPRNIYLNLFGGAHFHWGTLKARNIAKRTCLSCLKDSWMPSWSYCSLKRQIFHLLWARSPKIVGCRFTLKPQKQSPEAFCKKRCSWKFRKNHWKTTVPESLFSIKLQASAKFLRTSFLQNTSWRLLLTCTWHNNNIQLLLLLLL